MTISIARSRLRKKARQLLIGRSTPLNMSLRRSLQADSSRSRLTNCAALLGKSAFLPVRCSAPRWSCVIRTDGSVQLIFSLNLEGTHAGRRRFGRYLSN